MKTNMRPSPIRHKTNQKIQHNAPKDAKHTATAVSTTVDSAEVLDESVLLEKQLAQKLEKSWPKDHFAIYLVLAGPSSLGRTIPLVVRAYSSSDLLKDTLRPTVPLVSGAEQPL